MITFRSFQVIKYPAASTQMLLLAIRLRSQNQFYVESLSRAATAARVLNRAKEKHFA